MTKFDIIREIIKTTGVPKKLAKKGVEEIIFHIKDALSRAESVKLKKFGKFDVLTKRARTGRNPRTGESAQISARKVVRFKAGEYVRNIVSVRKVKSD